MPSQLPESMRLPDNISELVSRYLSCHRSGNEEDKPAAVFIGVMTHTAPPATLWDLVLEIVRQSRDDKDLIAAVVAISRLLRRHCDAELLARVEQQAVADPKFARVLTGLGDFDVPAWAWSRIARMQERVPDPL
jgi:hypothetical protein